MNGQNVQEMWEVEACGKVYQAAFEELPEWIVEGSLLPGDKVRRGNLRWIEAQKVPSLIPFFNAKENGLPMPVVTSIVNANPAKDERPVTPTAIAQDDSLKTEAPPATTPPPIWAEVSPANFAAGAADSASCSVHREREAAFQCENCAAGFCKACPKSYGGTVKICPGCGALCKPLREVRETLAKTALRQSANDE